MGWRGDDGIDSIFVFASVSSSIVNRSVDKFKKKDDVDALIFVIIKGQIAFSSCSVKNQNVIFCYYMAAGAALSDLTIGL